MMLITTVLRTHLHIFTRTRRLLRLISSSPSTEPFPFKLWVLVRRGRLLRIISSSPSIGPFLNTFQIRRNARRLETRQWLRLAISEHIPDSEECPAFGDETMVEA